MKMCWSRLVQPGLTSASPLLLTTTFLLIALDVLTISSLHNYRKFFTTHKYRHKNIIEYYFCMTHRYVTLVVSGMSDSLRIGSFERNFKKDLVIL